MKSNQVKALDKLFSEVIRLRANGFCEHCGHWVEFAGINPSHFAGRSNKMLRWDEYNVQGLCNDCHMRFTNHKNEYFLWILKRIGEDGMVDQIKRANTIQKQDYEVIKEQLQNRIKELQR